MNRFCLVVFSGSVLAACGIADIILKVPDQKSHTVLDERTVPVSYDDSGRPFLRVDGEKIGVDMDAGLPHAEIPSEVVMTKWKDQNGRMGVDFHTAAMTKDRDSDEHSEDVE